MQMSLARRAAIVAAAAAMMIAAAGAAFGAPVLQPGVTSAPGMSGKCTNCHTYAKPAAARPAVAVAPKVTAPKASHPYISAKKHHVGANFQVWGFIAPKVPNASEATLTIVVQKWTGGSWVPTSGLTAQATISGKGKFKNKMNYLATLNIGQTGRYRMHAKLVYKNAKGVTRKTISKWLVFRVFK